MLDMIQQQGTAEEQLLLPTVLESIQTACSKALAWLGDDQFRITLLNAYQFIGIGKRMDVETYNMVEPVFVPSVGLGNKL